MTQHNQIYNYINNLPDFLNIQRTSFCWFISEGLTDELGLFSSIYDFSQTTEYIIFGEEYNIIKPPYNLNIARKYNGNYRVQLILPIQIRNKKLNSIKCYNQFPAITLPLMTTYATFILNGCERVIVSQIIRSPGIYFERNTTNNSNYSNFKRKLPVEISKLRAFLPTGFAGISELNLFFSSPIRTVNSLGDEITLPSWSSTSLRSYSVNFLKKKENNLTFSFLQAFKFYHLINSQANNGKKKDLIVLFLKWLNINNNDRDANKMSYLLQYYNLLLRLTIKYRTNRQNLKVKNKTHTNFTKKVIEFHKIYDKTLERLQLIPHLEVNKNLIFAIGNYNNLLYKINNFYYLRNNIYSLIKRVVTTSSLINSTELQFQIYFSKTLKHQLKYVFKQRKKSSRHYSFTSNRHQYIKSKTRLLLFNNDYQIKTYSQAKYATKDCYSATIIPEYGSWIRLLFQKNTKINLQKYALKYQEENICIQFDKVNNKPILQLLTEIGFTDVEIYRNLEHADFFYFSSPLMINSHRLDSPLIKLSSQINTDSNFSDFPKIFDSNYYRMGKTGRSQLNKRLNLGISQRVQTITYEDIFAIVDKLLTLSLSKSLPDDIDHLKNRRVRSIGELLQNLFRIGFQRLTRKVKNQTNKIDTTYILSFNVINVTIREFFGSSQLSQYLDQTNPLASLTHRRRISGLGPGGFNRDRISFSVRDIHPSHYGRICPIETPEGQNVGLIASLTTCARVNRLGFLETPFWRVKNGKVLKTGDPIYLTADIEDCYKIAPADIFINNENYLSQSLIPVRYNQDFVNVSPSEVDFISISSVQVVSVAASLIPFFEHDDANRALMGSNMQRQSVPLLFPQKPIIGTGLENQVTVNSGMIIASQDRGIVEYVSSNQVIIRRKDGHKIKYKLQKYLRSNQQTCINNRPVVWKGEIVNSGQVLTDGPSISMSELSLGQNVLVAYMPWQGYNFEDAILISERLVYDDIFTSIHIERYKIEIDQTAELSEQTTNNIPNLTSSELENLNDDGIVKVGTFVTSGDILVGKVVVNEASEQFPESKLLRAIFGAKAKGVKDNSYRMKDGDHGRVIETISFNRKTRLTYQFEKIYIFIAQIRKIQVGDKIAGRHGNKGIISRILARQDMPFLPDGTPIDIILNPLGVPSRMNVGQLYECLLGLAGQKLNKRFKILPFDEVYGIEASRILINKKLRQASVMRNESWLFNPYAPGKMVLIDGRTGKEFENPITVGNAYMLKLIHLVDDKMHARATGPYSLITQQPLRGKAQHGGQRFGEMEVWALEGFGAAFTLKELLTIKSDDMQGRNDTLNAIVKGQQIPKFGIPESFKVLLQELRSIGLDMSTYKIDRFSKQKNYETEVNLIEKYNAFSKTFLPTSNVNDIRF